MSEKAVHAFLARLDEDPALKDQLRAEEAAAKDFFASAATFAARSGFEFTAGEFARVLGSTGWELREDDLEKVAGGLTPIQIPLLPDDRRGPIPRRRIIDD
jgi:predicted ribosomally synthesized peptide with nif11-like leader